MLTDDTGRFEGEVCFASWQPLFCQLTATWLFEVLSSKESQLILHLDWRSVSCRSWRIFVTLRSSRCSSQIEHYYTGTFTASLYWPHTIAQYCNNGLTCDIYVACFVCWFSYVFLVCGMSVNFFWVVWLWSCFSFCTFLKVQKCLENVWFSLLLDSSREIIFLMYDQ